MQTIWYVVQTEQFFDLFLEVVQAVGVVYLVWRHP
jgi:hypothetical protein